MAMNIENEETIRPAQELEGLTGESMTTAVTEALRRRLSRVPRAQKGSLAEHDFIHTDLKPALA